jgi:DegV family protein with EDD domain
VTNYQIFTDATSDLTEEVLEGLPKVGIVPMMVRVGDMEYIYGDKGDITVEEFYQKQKAGAYASTSQINPHTYTQYFKAALAEGKDVLYLCFSSGLSDTIQSARLAIQGLEDDYPDRRIVCIDTLCASLGEALLVKAALQLQAKGADIDEVTDWVLEHRMKVCHWFTVDMFDHLRHGGRVSMATAAAGSLLNIKPFLHVDDAGKLDVAGKPRGQRRAREAQMEKMVEGWQPEINQEVFVGHGANPEGASLLKEEIAKQFPGAKISILDVGPIIGAHTGPGLLLLTYWGNNR